MAAVAIRRRAWVVWSQRPGVGRCERRVGTDGSLRNGPNEAGNRKEKEGVEDDDSGVSALHGRVCGRVGIRERRSDALDTEVEDVATVAQDAVYRDEVDEAEPRDCKQEPHR